MNYKNLSLAFIGVIVLFVSIFIAFRLGQLNFESGFKTTPPLVKVYPTASQDEASAKTWQTYTNEEYGFEFKIPKNLYVTTSRVPLYTIWNSLEDSKTNPYSYFLNLEVFENTPDFKNSMKFVSDYKDNKLINIYQVSGETEETSCVISLPKGYLLFITSCDNTSLNNLLLVQTLSSFKLIEPKSDLKSEVESWNLYTLDSTRLSWDKCDAEPQASQDIKALASSNPVYRRIFNGLNIAYTSNNNYTQSEIKQFMLCEAGAYYPISAFSDKILWIRSCSTGIANGTTSQCVSTKTQIEKTYGYQK